MRDCESGRHREATSGDETLKSGAAPHPSLRLGAAPTGVLRRCDVVRVEVLIALDGKAKWSARFAQFAHANEADLLGPRLRSAVRASLRSSQCIHALAFAGMLLTLGPRPAGPLRYAFLLRKRTSPDFLSGRSQACCSP